MAKAKKPKKEKTPVAPETPNFKAVPQDLPAMEGPGVSRPKFKDIDRAGDAYKDATDQVATARDVAKKAKEALIAKMREHGLSVYYYGDMRVDVEEGKLGVKIKAVGNTENQAEEEEGSEE